MLLCIFLCFFLSQCSTNIHAIYFSSNENLLNSPFPNRFDCVCVMPSCFPWLQFGCVFACQDSKESMAIGLNSDFKISLIYLQCDLPNAMSIMKLMPSVFYSHTFFDVTVNKQKMMVFNILCKRIQMSV